MTSDPTSFTKPQRYQAKIIYGGTTCSNRRDSQQTRPTWWHEKVISG